VVGEIGFRDHVTFTALGDVPNVASRLEGLCKELDCEAVVSEEVLRLAGYGVDALPSHQARLRGRAEMVAARLFRTIGADAAHSSFVPAPQAV
jgi:adenylate cyclase